jgi:hypothetical protein
MTGIKRRTSGTTNREIRGKKDAAAKIPPDLPLLHVTAVGAAREIIDGGQLETRHCKVFKKDLLYFFMLRPAYRVSEADAKSDQVNRFPFVFIVDSRNLTAPYHVYPFDTGGAAAGIFGDEPDPYVKLEDYELSANLAAAAELIGWAFGSLDAYFKAEIRQGLKDALEQWESAARSYLTIAQLATVTRGTNRPDKRASAIEVAYNQHVQLKGNVALAILPKQLLESATASNDHFIARLSALGVTSEMYDWQPNSTPDEYFEEISRIAENYFRAQGIL